MPGRGSGTSKRGFASMDDEKQRRIARKGGETVSQNREHMSAIGRKGGEIVSRNREHMAEIGRKGGEAVSQDRRHIETGERGGESRSAPGRGGSNGQQQETRNG